MFAASRSISSRLSTRSVMRIEVDRLRHAICVTVAAACRRRCCARDAIPRKTAVQWVAARARCSICRCTRSIGDGAPPLALRAPLFGGGRGTAGLGRAPTDGDRVDSMGRSSGWMDPIDLLDPMDSRGGAGVASEANRSACVRLPRLRLATLT